MKDRLIRTKNFVREHKVGIVIGTGVVVVAVIVVMKAKGANTPGIINKLIVEPDKLQSLIDNPESVISFNVIERDHLAH